MNSITARNKSEKRFKMYGKVAVTVAISFLVILLYNIFSSGISAFKQTYVAVQLDIPANLDKKTLNPRSELNKSFLKINSLLSTLKNYFLKLNSDIIYEKSFNNWSDWPRWILPCRVAS